MTTHDVIKIYSSQDDYQLAYTGIQKILDKLLNPKIAIPKVPKKFPRDKGYLWKYLMHVNLENHKKQISNLRPFMDGNNKGFRDWYEMNKDAYLAAKEQRALLEAEKREKYQSEMAGAKSYVIYLDSVAKKSDAISIGRSIVSYLKSKGILAEAIPEFYQASSRHDESSRWELVVDVKSDTDIESLLGDDFPRWGNISYISSYDT